MILSFGCAYCLSCGSQTETREVIVQNQSPGVINLVWCCEEERPQVKLEIEPKQFVCNGFSSTSCSLSVEAIMEGSFLVVFKYVINFFYAFNILVLLSHKRSDTLAHIEIEV